MGDTHITGRHIGGGTHITSVICVPCLRGYTYHGVTHITAKPGFHPTVRKWSNLLLILNFVFSV